MDGLGASNGLDTLEKFKRSETVPNWAIKKKKKKINNIQYSDSLVSRKIWFYSSFEPKMNWNSPLLLNCWSTGCIELATKGHFFLIIWCPFMVGSHNISPSSNSTIFSRIQDTSQEKSFAVNREPSCSKTCMGILFIYLGLFLWDFWPSELILAPKKYLCFESYLKGRLMSKNKNVSAKVEICSVVVCVLVGTCKRAF